MSTEELETSTETETAAPAPPLPPHHKWYVIHTYSGFENKVKQSIEQQVAAKGKGDAVSQVLIPTETVVELRKGRRREASQKFSRATSWSGWR